MTIKNVKRTIAHALAISTMLTAPGLASNNDEIVSAEEVNSVVYSGGAIPDGRNALAAKVQILLDRFGASPGVIDGFGGENVAKAIVAFEVSAGLPADGILDAQTFEVLLQAAGQPIVTYTITEQDIASIVSELPSDYGELAKRDWLGFTSIEEALGERFHTDVDFLKMLNPNASFVAGEQIWAPDIGVPVEGKVATIVADKAVGRVLAYNANNQLLTSYPATIGSDATPSPSGEHEVRAIAMEPTYSYNPDLNFQQGENTEPLTLPAGPNGPVGIAWIDLSKPTYGIHGTPEPAKIDKSSSNGCIRLTNWDATELANLVKPGVRVIFKD